MSIRHLPPLLINQIAAGEVIERPASVAKELLENAIDAGASRIELSLEEGGKELVQVVDDGAGIPGEQLPLAVAPHATSKIVEAEDLDAIATMGFRGEALASIASVSRLLIRSRTPGSDEAWSLKAEGDQVEQPTPAGGPAGTLVAVRNLFFNTPARRKFLKTDQTELTRCREAFNAIALAHPAIGFTLRIDGRVAAEWPATDDPATRVLAVIGEELREELLPLEIDDRGLRLWGMLGRPGIARSTQRHLHVFLNGRRITDRTVNHAIKEAYRGLIEPTRHPTAVLFIRIDPAEVDVNVHPAKAEVRFRHSGRVHGTVMRSIRERLRAADLTPTFDLQRTADGQRTGAWSFERPLPPMPEFGSGMNDAGPPPDAEGRAGVPSSGGGGGGGGGDGASAFVDYFRRLDPVQKGFVYTEVKQALERESPEVLTERDGSNDRESSSDASSSDELINSEQLPAGVSILQVHSSYIVTQDETGLVIIDQHALHERVMFEKLKDRIAQRGVLESQRLLMPITLNIEPAQAETLESLAPLLQKLGIEAELMGPTTLAVHAFTSLLFERNVEPMEFMLDLLRRSEDEGLPNETEAAIHEVLDMMACKAAVKAGDQLTEAELAELLRYREKIERSSNCPHGRPTSLRLSLKELERQFGRT